MVEVSDTGVQTVNVSWRLSPSIAAAASVILVFSLTVNYGSHVKVATLNEPYYNFSAPKGASSCEVYNFTVTATYVGATYTGTDCPFIGTSLNRMLPSLPDTWRLNSSLQYTLAKGSGGLNLNISFEVYLCHLWNVPTYV